MIDIPQELLRNATRVAIFTGAGISQESGIATFRSPDGIWAKFKPEELANINAFMANPERLWEWYEYRRNVVEDAVPNPSHLAIVELEKIFDRVDVITQNVDGLHTRAGSSRVYELHGSLLKHRCLDCQTPYEISGDKEGVQRCPKCGGLIRPGVVWFGEDLPEYEWERAVDATINCDLFLSIGTSTIVYPAAGLPFMAVREGKYVIEVNPERTEFSRYTDLYLEGKAGELLPKLVEELRNSRK